MSCLTFTCLDSRSSGVALVGQLVLQVPHTLLQVVVELIPQLPGQLNIYFARKKMHWSSEKKHFDGKRSVNGNVAKGLREPFPVRKQHKW